MFITTKLLAVAAFMSLLSGFTAAQSDSQIHIKTYDSEDCSGNPTTDIQYVGTGTYDGSTHGNSVTVAATDCILTVYAGDNQDGQSVGTTSSGCVDPGFTFNSYQAICN